MRSRWTRSLRRPGGMLGRDPDVKGDPAQAAKRGTTMRHDVHECVVPRMIRSETTLEMHRLPSCGGRPSLMCLNSSSTLETRSSQKRSTPRPLQGVGGVALILPLDEETIGLVEVQNVCARVVVSSSGMRYGWRWSRLRPASASLFVFLLRVVRAVTPRPAVSSRVEARLERQHGWRPVGMRSSGTQCGRASPGAALGADATEQMGGAMQVVAPRAATKLTRRDRDSAVRCTRDDWTVFTMASGKALRIARTRRLRGRVHNLNPY
ncbi:hypothetical protein B0H11DRAFT_23911 [Mycena galericulata]|nr:hypothetical protein B0H11DRAFT_23911 [Mycena galericulata]